MDPLPPDPYQALGLPPDVDQETIKKTYRKLVLKCHPDKVTDQSLKQQKQEEFHKIQQAYELIGEEGARERYTAEVKLEALRREKAARGASQGGPDIRTARYDVRTQAPAGASFKASAPPRYEEHKPARYSDDRDRERYFDDRSRSKYTDTYDAYPSRHSTSRSSREKVSPQKSTRESSDRTRSDNKKSRDKERDRERRHVASERERDSDLSGDDKARYEAEYKRRSDDARTREAAAELRRQAEDRRSYEEQYDRKQKIDDQASNAVRYIHMSSKISPSKPSSSRDYYEPRDGRDRRDDRSRRDRPEVVRRSSARPRDRHSPSRKGPEIVDWEDDRKMPSFKHSTSSPEIQVPRSTPHRSFTESSRHRHSETSPTPMFRRADTMPAVPQAQSASRKSSAAPRSSGLRDSVTPHDSGSSSPDYPTIPPATTKRYFYPTPGGNGVTLAPEDVGVANGHRTVLREPERQRHRSPSPLTTRPPMGANRPSESGSVRYTTAVPGSASVPPPPLGRSATMGGSDDRGRSSRLHYGEIPSDYSRRENARRQTSFPAEQVSYSKRFATDDVNFASRSSGRDRDREYPTKPMLSRNPTYVY